MSGGQWVHPDRAGPAADRVPFHVGVASAFGKPPPGMAAGLARRLHPLLDRRARRDGVSLWVVMGSEVSAPAHEVAKRFGWQASMVGGETEWRGAVHLAAICDAVILVEPAGGLDDGWRWFLSVCDRLKVPRRVVRIN